MSLIADALRKAGPNTPLSPAPPPPKSPWGTRALLIACSGLALLLWARLPIQQKPSPGPTSTSSLKTTPKPTLIASHPMGFNLLRSAQSQWRLNGIVQGDGQAIALINGKVVEKGESIQGAKLVRIAQDEVDLETDGQIKTLKLHEQKATEF